MVLDLQASGADEVVFRAQLHTPDGGWSSDARVQLAGGEVSFGDWTADADADAASAPPAWLVAQAVAFLRTEWRARRGADPEPWPNRVNRWREERD